MGLSQFRYTARDAQGKTVKGILTADGIPSFYASLREQGLYCLSYSEDADAQQARRRLHKMKTRELIVFCRKMGTMMESGLSMTGAFEVLYQTAETPAIRELYLSVYEKASRGGCPSRRRCGSRGSLSRLSLPT